MFKQIKVVFKYLSHLAVTAPDTKRDIKPKVEDAMEAMEIETCQQTQVATLLDMVIGAY